MTTDASPMRAVILAAGRGSRMGAATQDRPKCLVELAGRPLLAWQVEALKQADIAEIGIVCGYKGSSITWPDLHKFENPDWARTNMVVSLTCASDWLRTSGCIVSYADIVYPADTVRRLIEAPGDIVVAYDRRWLDLWSLRFADPLEDAETFRTNDAGDLVEIGGRAATLDEIQGQYMGLLRFTPIGWEHIAIHLSTLAPVHVERIDMTGLLRSLIAQGTTIRTVAVEGRWFELDSDRDLELCHALMNQPGVGAWLSGRECGQPAIQLQRSAQAHDC